jgi:flagellar basal body-associated protein FliL
MLERFLLFILITMLAVIALGTLWTLIRPAAPVAVSQNGDPAASAPQNQIDMRIFTGIGRIRARLAPPARNGTAANGGEAALVIAIGFPYNNSDRAFLEELSLNVGKFRAATIDYFNTIPADSPLLSDETSLKKELLTRYNRLLRLGNIETLYFSEYVIID